MRTLPLLIFSLFFLLLTNCNSDSAQTQEEKIEKATIAQIEEGIKAHIKTEESRNNGVFRLKTDTAEFNMRLVRVHTEYLSNLGPGRYFACVDLAVENGNVYDVDFFLEGTPENMRVTKKTVHKLNGKPYYTWKQNKEDGTWFTVPTDQADRTLLGVIEKEDSFHFNYTIHLPKIEGKGELWIPVAQSDDYQTVEIKKQDFPKPPKVLTDSLYGNKAFYLKVGPEQSHQDIVIRYAVKRLEKPPYGAGEAMNRSLYLQSNTLIPVNDDFASIARKAIGSKTKDDTLMMARALYDYVIDSMKYIKDGKYGTGDAVYACDAQSGNCTEFHSYFMALARSIGIPARFGIGAAIPSSRDEGGVNGYHCWAEFYADGKWWPVDISEANKYSDLATYYFGHHPANRIAFSEGRDIHFDPLPATGPINFLAYPVMEVNGGIVRPEVDFTFTRP